MHKSQHSAMKPPSCTTFSPLGTCLGEAFLIQGVLCVDFFVAKKKNSLFCMLGVLERGLEHVFICFQCFGCLFERIYIVLLKEPVRKGSRMSCFVFVVWPGF